MLLNKSPRFVIYSPHSEGFYEAMDNYAKELLKGESERMTE
jgi:hypothetical protein